MVGRLALANMLRSTEHARKDPVLDDVDDHRCWRCWNTSTAEDQHCRRTCWPEGESDKDMMLFNTEHD